MTKPIVLPETPALLLRRDRAAAALDMSPTTFDEAVRPHVPSLRLGSVERWSVDALRVWAADAQQVAEAVPVLTEQQRNPTRRSR